MSQVEYYGVTSEDMQAETGAHQARLKAKDCGFARFQLWSINAGHFLLPGWVLKRAD